ncbi:MAG TPA: hemolysin family protein [Thermoanaerobaculia bacterium]|nr:hemolysin family protein [Thermoanaerobaculia bacterium]
MTPSLLGSLAVALAAVAYVVIVISALLERSGPIRLRHFAEEARGRLRDLFDQPRRFEAFRYLLSFVAKVIPSVVAVLLLLWLESLGIPGGRATLAAVGVVALLALLVELSNRRLVSHDPEEALRRLTWLYRACLVLASPLVPLVALWMPDTEGEDEDDSDDDEASQEEIEEFIAVGEREGILEPDQGEMVRGVVDLGETQAKSVMTPRIDMVCAPIESSLDELASRFIESKRSRIPLYRESIDHIVGVLHVRDLLRGLYAGQRPTAADIAKPPYFVPLTKPLDELLRELQARFQQMALVVDEYGGVAGLVTFEDLVEEIVGDISEEPESLAETPQPLADGSWRIEGRRHIEELADLVGVEVEEGPYETVGGLILHMLGEVPEVGAVVETQGLKLTVEEIRERRIERVRIEKLGSEEKEAYA